jgi:hypothetical protein
MRVEGLHMHSSLVSFPAIGGARLNANEIAAKVTSFSDGKRAVPIEEIARKLTCSVYAAERALQAAELQGLVRETENGWVAR